MRFMVKFLIFCIIIFLLTVVGPGVFFREAIMASLKNGDLHDQLEDIGYLLKIGGAFVMVIGFPLIITILITASVKSSDKIGDAICGKPKEKKE